MTQRDAHNSDWIGDAVERIQSFNAGREPERLALKYRKMAADCFSFFRGSCHIFYARLAQRYVAHQAPLAWISGDLHLENFGSYKADNRLVYFDVNDFDEAALAPLDWELERLLASIWIGAEGICTSAAQSRAVCEAFLSAYAQALAGGKAYWVERETADGPVRALLDGVRDRTRTQYLDARTEGHGKKRKIRVDGKKALPASDAQRTAVAQHMAEFAATQADPAFFEVLDVARRIAGTGSLGLERYVVLVHGKGSPDGNYLLDLKAATPSAVAPCLVGVPDVRQPHWASQAQRLVTLQQRSQAVPMAFLQAVTLGGSDYVLRGLQPSEDRVAIAAGQLGLADLQALVVTMGKLVAWAQLRSSGRQGSANADALVDYGQRTDWQAPLMKASFAAAQLVRADWEAYCKAYAAGAFHGH